MSIAQEHVLGRVMLESPFNSQKIRVMSIKKDNFVKVHKWGTRSTIFHARPDILKKSLCISKSNIGIAIQAGIRKIFFS
jgi:hypothetical protein